MMPRGTVAHDQPTSTPNIDFQVGGHCDQIGRYHLSIISSETELKKSAGVRAESIAGTSRYPSEQGLLSKGEA